MGISHWFFGKLLNFVTLLYAKRKIKPHKYEKDLNN